MCVCVCVCVCVLRMDNEITLFRYDGSTLYREQVFPEREREREGVCVCVRERERVCV